MATLAVFGTMLLAGTASAAQGDSFACQFAGLSGTLDPPIPAAASFPAGFQQTGTYNLGTRATCVVEEVDGVAPLVTGATITSDRGYYMNLICGTGTWQGQPNRTTIDFDSFAVADITGIRYIIFFVGGAGVLEVDHTSGYAGGGVAYIVPRDLSPTGHPHGNCVDAPVDEFSFSAAFAAVDRRASAAQGDLAACQFAGLSGQLNPPLPGAASFPAGFQQTGTYNFSGRATCVGQQGGTPIVSGATITSAGQYMNLVCGTGTAQGNVNGTTVNWDVATATDITDVRYIIAFVGGNGALEVDHTSGYAGGGVVNIIPRDLSPTGHPHGNCVDAAVDEFSVTGAFAVARR